MSDSRSSSPGPSTRKRSRRLHGIDPETGRDNVNSDVLRILPDDNNPESGRDNVDLNVLRILPDDNGSQVVSIERPPYMSKRSDLHDVDFGKLTEEKYYIDKTEFISKVFELSAWAIAIFRHRNAMKTTHLKSIEYYCDWKSDELDVEKLKVNINDHTRKYCVLFIPFDKIVFDGNSNDVLAALKVVIVSSVKGYLQNHLSGNAEIKHVMEELLSSPEADLLRDVCFEFSQTFSKKVIVLIDNVDVPFLHYDVKNVELAYKTFFNGFTADHSPFLFKIIMMGNIAPHIFFKLSSFGAKMLVDTGYECNSIGLRYFTFSEEDVTNLCHKYDYPVTQAIPELKLRYGGYVTKNESSLFNSFSIIQFFNSNSVFNLTNNSPVEIMWYNFHSKDVLHVSENIQISKAEQFIWTRILDSLNGNIAVNITIIPNYAEFGNNLSMGFMYLLFGGYVTVVKEENNRTILKIPNREVEEIFRERRNAFMSCDQSSANYDEPNTLFNEGNYEKFCIYLNKLLMKCSSRTFDRELSYHVFFLVILACNRVFKFRDEPETGLGFSDIVLIPKTRGVRKPIVIELAYLETKRNNQLDHIFKEKLKQVKSRQYGLSLLDDYEIMDILIVVGCNRALHCKCYPDMNVPK